MGIYIAETRTILSHTEAGEVYMLAFKVAYNPYIVEMRTRSSHTEVGVADMLPFKVACNPPGKMVSAIAGSRGLWG